MITLLEFYRDVDISPVYSADAAVLTLNNVLHCYLPTFMAVCHRVKQFCIRFCADDVVFRTEFTRKLRPRFPNMIE
jgi:hypothetical protein